MGPYAKDNGQYTVKTPVLVRLLYLSSVERVEYLDEGLLKNIATLYNIINL